MRPVTTFAALALLFCSAPAAAEIYRYQDAQGKDHFVMSLDEVPPAYRAQALERARSAAKRINVVGPKPKQQVGPTERGRRSSPAHPRPISHSVGSEESWRARFAQKQRAIDKAERELERANGAERTMRAGRSSSTRGVQRRWAREQRRQDGVERRIEAAEERLRRAENDMFELRQRAAARGVPVEWMR